MKLYNGSFLHFVQKSINIGGNFVFYRVCQKRRLDILSFSCISIWHVCVWIFKPILQIVYIVLQINTLPCFAWFRALPYILDISKKRTGPCELSRGHTRACICSSHSGNILLKSTWQYFWDNILLKVSWNYFVLRILFLTFHAPIAVGFSWIFKVNIFLNRWKIEICSIIR